MIEQAITNIKIVKTRYLSAGDLDKLIFYCGGGNARPCIIHDSNPLPVRDEMIDSLKKMRNVEVLDKVFPDPKVSDIMDMANVLKGERIDVIIGIGGGSSLDSAKGVAAILSNGGDLDDYLGTQATKKIEKRDVKLILIPTTTGTGSEVTKFGVYTSRSGRKYTLNNPLLQADIALLVSEYIYSLPASILAATAFDALSHALETLWNRNATPLSDKVATESAVHILRWMEIAFDSALLNKEDGRAEMLEGACMAGIAFNMTRTAAVHAISFILSEEWHVPHGVACAFVIEDILKLNVADAQTKGKLVLIAKTLFGDDPDDELIQRLIGRIVGLKRKFNLPFSFSDLGIVLYEDKINALFNKSLADPKMKNNIIFVDQKELFNIIKRKL